MPHAETAVTPAAVAAPARFHCTFPDATIFGGAPGPLVLIGTEEEVRPFIQRMRTREHERAHHIFRRESSGSMEDLD